MQYKIEEDSHYLLALKNLSFDEIVEYLTNEDFEMFLNSKEFNQIKNKNGFYSILESIYVKPENRGNGFAKSLMFKYLKDVKATVYILLADTSSDTDEFSIESFYEEFGFKTIYYDCFALMIKK